MFKPLVTRFLQHLTHQNNWSRAHLIGFSGKVVQFKIAFIRTNLLILEDGSLNIAGDTATPDAIIHIPPSLALRIFSGDEAAKTQINIEGDTHLVTEFSKILQLIRWDIEEDLSQVIGDIPANKMVYFSNKAISEAKKQTLNLTEMLTEFWQEEKPILAKKRHVEQFNAAVDTLRSDVARIEKRVEKLFKNYQESDNK
ncbi:MAG: ubiquinone biosynthesis accessory factor UbiJ [Methylophilaceae bacterium]